MEQFWSNVIAWSIVIGGFALYLAMLNHEKTRVVNLKFNNNGMLFLFRRISANRKFLRVFPSTVQNPTDSTDAQSYSLYYDNGLQYNPSKRLSVINAVDLTNSTLLEKAKQNAFIRQFLRGNRLILTHNLMPSHQIDSTLESDTGYSALLTKEDCNRILAWLCGDC